MQTWKIKVLFPIKKGDWTKIKLFANSWRHSRHAYSVGIFASGRCFSTHKRKILDFCLPAIGLSRGKGRIKNNAIKQTRTVLCTIGYQVQLSNYYHHSDSCMILLVAIEFSSSLGPLPLFLPTRTAYNKNDNNLRIWSGDDGLKQSALRQTTLFLDPCYGRVNFHRTRPMQINCIDSAGLMALRYMAIVIFRSCGQLPHHFLEYRHYRWRHRCRPHFYQVIGEQNPDFVFLMPL